MVNENDLQLNKPSWDITAGIGSETDFVVLEPEFDLTAFVRDLCRGYQKPRVMTVVQASSFQKEQIIQFCKDRGMGYKTVYKDGYTCFYTDGFLYDLSLKNEIDFNILTGATVLDDAGAKVLYIFNNFKDAEDFDDAVIEYGDFSDELGGFICAGHKNTGVHPISGLAANIAGYCKDNHFDYAHLAYISNSENSFIAKNVDVLSGTTHVKDGGCEIIVNKNVGTMLVDKRQRGHKGVGLVVETLSKLGSLQSYVQNVDATLCLVFCKKDTDLTTADIEITGQQIYDGIMIAHAK